jgi:hypothetical protein
VLDADGYDAFVEAGNPFDAAVAQRLQRHIYSSGNSVEPGAAYARFRGRAATVTPLLRKRGLLVCDPPPPCSTTSAPRVQGPEDAFHSTSLVCPCARITSRDQPRAWHCCSCTVGAGPGSSGSAPPLPPPQPARLKTPATRLAHGQCRPRLGRAGPQIGSGIVARQVLHRLEPPGPGLTDRQFLAV